jgi:hypothetical protein
MYEVWSFVTYSRDWEFCLLVKLTQFILLRIVLDPGQNKLTNVIEGLSIDTWGFQMETQASPAHYE